MFADSVVMVHHCHVKERLSCNRIVAFDVKDFNVGINSAQLNVMAMSVYSYAAFF